jgi:hypothetical protein
MIETYTIRTTNNSASVDLQVLIFADGAIFTGLIN